MFRVNENYLKLPGSYLFSTIAKKVAAYQKENPDKKLIRLGIGDVTLPIAPAIIDAMHKAVDEMAVAETFHGYAPDLGYEFLRSAIRENDYKARGVDIALDEILLVTEQNQIQVILVIFLQKITESLYVTLFILYMLTQTLWQEEQENSLRKLKAGAM